MRFVVFSFFPFPPAEERTNLRLERMSVKCHLSLAGMYVSIL